MNLPIDTSISVGARFAVPGRIPAKKRLRQRLHNRIAPERSGRFAKAITTWSDLSVASRSRPYLRKRPGVTLVDLRNSLIEAMLADPMVQLVMQGDGYSHGEMRRLYCIAAPVTRQSSEPRFSYKVPAADPTSNSGPRPGSPRPGIGE